MQTSVETPPERDKPKKLLDRMRDGFALATAEPERIVISHPDPGFSSREHFEKVRSFSRRQTNKCWVASKPKWSGLREQQRTPASAHPSLPLKYAKVNFTRLAGLAETAATGARRSARRSTGAANCLAPQRFSAQMRAVGAGYNQRLAGAT